MGLTIDPKKYAEGTLGPMGPDFLDLTDPRKNPLDADQTSAFYEVEINVGDNANAPLPKPDYVENPRNVPSAFSMGISELPKFSPPQVTKEL
jgi:hypothetical protein